MHIIEETCNLSFLLESMTLIFERGGCDRKYGISYDIPGGKHKMSALITITI